MNGQTVEDPVQKKILKAVDDSKKDHIRFKDLQKQLDTPKSTLSVKINDLKDEGFLHDKGWKENESKYVLPEDVNVNTQLHVENFVRTRLMINIGQVAVFIALLWSVQFTNTALVYLAFLLGLLPTFAYTVMQTLMNEELFGVQVSKTE